MTDGERPGPGGWNRIHLIVDDIATEVARLKAEGVKFRNDIVGGPGGSPVLVVDPSGNWWSVSAGEAVSRSMTKQVLFIQGGGAGVHDAWDDKLVASLRRELGPGYDVHYPRMPNEADPSYAVWKAALSEEIAGLDDRAVAIGHSVGGTILINALAEGPPKRRLAGIFLIAAPFVDPGGWPSDDIKPMADLGARLPPKTPVYLYHGGEDDIAPLAHVDLYERAIPGVVVHRLPAAIISSTMI